MLPPFSSSALAATPIPSVSSSSPAVTVLRNTSTVAELAPGSWSAWLSAAGVPSSDRATRGVPVTSTAASKVTLTSIVSPRSYSPSEGGLVKATEETSAAVTSSFSMVPVAVFGVPSPAFEEGSASVTVNVSSPSWLLSSPVATEMVPVVCPARIVSCAPAAGAV